MWVILLELKRNSETELIVRVLKEDQNTQKVKHSFFFFSRTIQKKKKKKGEISRKILFFNRQLLFYTNKQWEMKRLFGRIN